MEHTDHLIIRAQRGDRQALNQLFNSWYQSVYGIAYRYFGEAEPAKEVSQQAFIQVQQKLGELKDPASFRVWLYRMVVNLCHMEIRRNQTRRRRYEGYGNVRSMGLAPSPDELYEQREQTEMVLAALQQIPREQRTVIIMKEYEGLKFREIAEILEISENTVKSRLYYGLKALRNFFLNNDLKNEVYHG
jgi:RNA polymerase sigma-70 factor (ECF subfamily)